MKHFYTLLALAALSCTTAFAQWSTDRNLATPIFDNGLNVYSDELCVGADGTTWFFFDHPSSVSVDSVRTASYQMRLQAWTADGQRKFGDEGMLISSYNNRSWTMCNHYLHANRDSTITLVIHDCRNSTAQDMSYTAYRIRPDGTHVWDEEGVPVDNAMVIDYCYFMDIDELEDGSNVFTWTYSGSDGSNCYVTQQRITKDGQPQWDPTEMRMSGAYNQWSWVVDAGNNQYIVVYGRSSSLYLTAMKYNADGTQAWDKRVTIYDGGFGTIPIWTFVNVISSGDGGVLVSWYDDRDNDNVNDVYIAYVKNDGTLGMTNAEGGADIKVAYSYNLKYAPDVCLDGMGTGFLVCWRDMPSGQSWGSVGIQHVLLNGELAWDDCGISLYDVEPDLYYSDEASYVSILPGAEGQFGVFWQRYNNGYYEITTHASIRNLSDGMPVSPATETINVVEGRRYCSSLESHLDTVNQRWILKWDDNGASSDESWENFFLQPLSFDGSMPGADAAISQVRADGNTLLDGQLYDLQGHPVTAPSAHGIYLLRQSGATHKILR